jgi:hypothetical protein
MPWILGEEHVEKRRRRGRCAPLREAARESYIREAVGLVSRELSAMNPLAAPLGGS